MNTFTALAWTMITIANLAALLKTRQLWHHIVAHQQQVDDHMERTRLHLVKTYELRGLPVPPNLLLSNWQEKSN